MKTITIEIGDLDKGSYPLRLFEFTGAGVKKELADGTIPKDLKAAGVKGDPLTFADFVLKNAGAAMVLRQMGIDLFQLLTQGDAASVGLAWSQLRNLAEPLRTLLEIKPKDLRLLPWELVCDEKDPNRPFNRLSLDSDKPFARARSYQSSAAPDPFSWLRVLVVVASRDPAINADAELRLIEDALRLVNRTIDVEVLPLPTKTEMLAAITSLVRPHIFHFIGHSGENANEEMVLWLDHAKPSEPREFWTANEIQTDLKGNDFLRFVFLNSCRSHGAVSSKDQQQTLSIGDAFVSAKVPAVLAMQADVQGEYAGYLAGKIYQELSKGEPLDVALVRGRIEVQQKMADGLNCREWALPALSLSIAPENVLPITRVCEQRRVDKIKNCPKFLEVIPLFVNRIDERRGFLRSFNPISPGLIEHHVAVIRGDSEIGKSWITCWYMEGCAWQDYNVRYVDVVSDKSKDWLDVLLQIRDGDEDEKQFSPLHEPLEPDAFHAFNWELHHRLQGNTPPIWNDEIIDPPPKKGDRTVNDLASSNKDFIELTFTAFQGALQKAAGSKPLLLVLDHFTRKPAALEPASMNELIRRLIMPIARGSLKPIKLVMVMMETEFSDYRIPETLRAPFANVPMKMLEGKKFVELATEFLQLKGLALDNFSRMLIQTRAENIKEWKPTELKELYAKIEETLKWIKGP